MNDDNKTLELRVGIFVLLGLIAIAVMAVQFGRVGQGLTDYYQLRVIFSNASGLLKNSDVQLSGAIVGYVGSKPTIYEGKVGRVSVNIFIRENILIPKGSIFQVGSSGMLGDKFVEIIIPEDLENARPNADDPKTFYADGETVEGTKQGGFNELAQKAEVAMIKLSENLDALKGTIGKLETGILSDENLENIRLSFSNIKTTGENFATASKGFSEVIDEAKGTMGTAREAMDSAKTTMSTANKAAEDIRLAIADARTAIKHADVLIKTAQGGRGTIPTLLNNPDLAGNLQALLANLRKHGVLFYKDSASKAEQHAHPRPPERQRRPTTPTRRTP